MNDKERANFQQVLLARQIRAELSMGNDFISDRSVYDILAYSLDCKNTDDIESQAKFYVANNPYDLIFYFPIEFEMEKDGVRPEDEKYRELIDLRIRTFAKNYITITGTIDERLEKIRAEIRKYESKNRKKTQIG
jgi:nicotinamide riboside kinase